MFDLPTGTRQERKSAAGFRKELKKMGFDMLQFSVYSRITKNNDDAKKYINKVKMLLPSAGSVRLLQITEKQYSAMQILLGEKTPTENLLDAKDLLVL